MMKNIIIDGSYKIYVDYYIAKQSNNHKLK